MYGKNHKENRDVVKYADSVIIGWYLLGYPTLKDIEADFSDDDILDFYEQVWN